MKSLSIALTIALFSSASAGAATLHVPSHYGTIQAAINAALPGDVVEVAGGTYFEDLWINNKSNLTLRSAPGDTVIVDAGGFGTPLRIFGGAISGIVVKKMTFRNTSDGGGIWIGSVNDVRIEKCVITGVAWDAVNVSFSSSVLVKKCVIDSPGRHGILSFHGGLRASKNKINFATENGIVLIGNQNGAVGNKIMNPAVNGIMVGNGANASANNLVQNNQVTLAGSDGIHCTDLATSTTISGNVLGKCQDDGIQLAIGADWNVVFDNRIGRAGDSGAQISSDHNTVRDNVVKKPVFDGIWLSASSNSGTYDRNTVSKSAADGFDVWGTGNTFRYNRGSRSATFDLREHNAPGWNTYLFNSFGTVAP